jgi:hypothetical protein
MAGNETNFFIRMQTDGSTLPLGLWGLVQVVMHYIDSEMILV